MEKIGWEGCQEDGNRGEEVEIRGSEEESKEIWEGRKKEIDSIGKYTVEKPDGEPDRTKRGGTECDKEKKMFQLE